MYQQITLQVCCRWRLKLSRVTKERFYKRHTVQSHIEDSGSALLHEYKCEWVSGLFICQWVRTHLSACPSLFLLLVQQYFDWNTFIRGELGWDGNEWLGEKKKRNRKTPAVMVSSGQRGEEEPGGLDELTALPSDRENTIHCFPPEVRRSSTSPPILVHPV